MKILICGAGKIGLHLIKYLTTQNHELLVIDISAKAIEKVQKFFDVNTIVGNASLPKLLSTLDLHNVELVIAATSDDNTNLVICELFDHLFHTAQKIARLDNIDDIEFCHKMSIDFIFSTKSAISQFLYDMATGIKSVKLIQHDLYINFFNKQQSSAAQENAVMTLGAIQGDIFSVALEDLESADTIITISHTEGLNKSINKHDIIIIGGNSVSINLAKRFITIGCKVSIIEPNYNIAKALAPIVTDASIIHGNAVEREILIESGINEDSIIVSATDNDQINLISLLMAKSIGPYNSIGIINTHASYIKVARNADIDHLKSINTIVVHSIIQFLVPDHITLLHHIKPWYIFLIKAVNIEAIEQFKKLKSVQLIVIRNDQCLLPKDIEEIIIGDEIVVLTKELINS